MFVLEALVLTFATTPTVSYLYPPHLHTRATATGPSFLDVRGPKDDEGGIDDRTMTTKHNEEGVFKRRFTVVLDKLEHLPSLMAITKLLQPSSPYSQTESTFRQSLGKEVEVPTHFGALRLIELSDRPSDLLKTSATDALLHSDPLIAIFRTFAELNELPVSASLSIEPFESLATSVAEHVRVVGSELVLVPWLPSALKLDNNQSEPGSHNATQDRTGSPFDALFRLDRSTSLPHSHFVRSVFAHAGTNVALLIGLAPFAAVRGQTHVFLPFFGGPDDRLALDFVVQLCANPRVRATVVRITKRDIQADVSAPDTAHLTNEEKEEENVQRNGLTITSLRSVRCTSKNIFGSTKKKGRNRADECPCHGVLRRFFIIDGDDDRIPRHDVRQRNDSDTAAVRDCRRDLLGAVRRAFGRAKPPHPAIARCALTHDVRRAREPHTATRHAATGAPDAAGAAAFAYCCRRRALASHGGGGPPCGASRARDGIWRHSGVGALRCSQDGWGRRNCVCDGGH